LGTQIPELKGPAHYYFDGKGKLFRPMAVMLAGNACNVHLKNERFEYFLFCQDLIPSIRQFLVLQKC